MSNLKGTRTLGDRQSEGLRRLRLAMESRGWRARELAEAIGVDKATPHAWLWGDLKPDMEKASVIERVLSIPIVLWTLPPEKPIPLPGEQRSPSQKRSPMRASKPSHSGQR